MSIYAPTFIRKHTKLAALLWLLSSTLTPVHAADGANNLYVPINRSTLITLAAPASEVLVANPDIADIHVHNSTNMTVIAKHFGHTNVRIMNKDGSVQRDIDIAVGYDLPAIRKALKNFLPDERISVEMVNTSVSLSGKVTSASAIDKALKITREFVYGNSAKPGGSGGAAPAAPAGGGLQAAAAGIGGGAAAGGSSPQGAGDQPDILNFMQIASGQQVMLKVRVGEINRTALKNLGIDLSGAVSDGFQFATGAAGLGGILQPLTAPSNTNVLFGPGHFQFPADSNGVPTNTQGLAIGSVTHNHVTLSGAIQALEQDGLFKLLAEPNLVAISGEQADFLAGGEIPIPVPQGGTGSGTTVTIQYKPYGVAVHFKPSVLSPTRINMEVQPEVSELDTANAVNINGFSVPALTTRRAKTTVELAPGEGFMIAGLLKDQTGATISQLPGAGELPILGALFRSTEFQRNETELVIAVTPYIVDPQKSADVKMPTDDFRPASEMEMFFYGALGSLANKPHQDAPVQSNQSLEGPTGFMVD